jgi:hypothetical protein
MAVWSRTARTSGKHTAGVGVPVLDGIVVAVEIEDGDRCSLDF